MLKKYPFLKWSLISLSAFVVLVVVFGFWFISLLPAAGNQDMSGIVPQDLAYISTTPDIQRGKVLAVVTSCDTMGKSGKETGYELTELSRTYYVWQANGFEVDVASPKGGSAPVVIDWDDMGPFDYAFLNDTTAQQKTKNTIPIETVNAEDYEAVYFLGGKGAMFDFPNDSRIQSIARKQFESQKVVGAICHGPAALVNVMLSDGSFLISGKKISGFTNEEELFLIPDAKEIFPFLLEDAMVSRGAQVNKGAVYLNTISRDGNLITAQNPWSTWTFAETMVEQMGYAPVKREVTAEENAISILTAFEQDGYDGAKNELHRLLVDEKRTIDRQLIAVHAIIASMQWEFGDATQLTRLLSYAKGL